MGKRIKPACLELDVHVVERGSTVFLVGGVIWPALCAPISVALAWLALLDRLGVYCSTRCLSNLGRVGSAG